MILDTPLRIRLQHVALLSWAKNAELSTLKMKILN